ncbi:hypothetical protein MNV49_007611 [Pseudohyphozyma bogoriensis]|nr:hypothetical protein MNV49_007611 [Pseudohyphozyma bogoriensis]
MSAAESAAYHFQLAQQHLEAAQRLAMAGSLPATSQQSPTSDGRSNFDPLRQSSYDYPDDTSTQYDDGASTYYDDGASTYYDDAGSTFGDPYPSAPPDIYDHPRQLSHSAPSVPSAPGLFGASRSSPALSSSYQGSHGTPTPPPANAYVALFGAQGAPVLHHSHSLPVPPIPTAYATPSAPSHPAAPTRASPSDAPSPPLPYQEFGQLRVNTQPTSHNTYPQEKNGAPRPQFHTGEMVASPVAAVPQPASAPRRPQRQRSEFSAMAMEAPSTFASALYGGVAPSAASAFYPGRGGPHASESSSRDSMASESTIIPESGASPPPHQIGVALSEEGDDQWYDTESVRSYGTAPAPPDDNEEFHGFRPRLGSVPYPAAGYPTPRPMPQYTPYYSPPPPAPAPAKTLAIHARPLEYDHTLPYATAAPRATTPTANILQSQATPSPSGSTTTVQLIDEVSTPPAVAASLAATSTRPTHTSHVQTNWMHPGIPLPPTPPDRPTSPMSMVSTKSSRSGRTLSMIRSRLNPRVRFATPTPEERSKTESPEEVARDEKDRRAQAHKQLEASFNMLM